MTQERKTVSGVLLPSKLDEQPDRIRLEPVKGTATAVYGEHELARSEDAVRLFEADYPPVIYIPREDANMEMLERTKQTTFCPFKGTASYYSIRGSGPHGIDAVWSYEDPFVEMKDIEGYLAFYGDRVDVKEH